MKLGKRLTLPTRLSIEVDKTTFESRLGKTSNAKILKLEFIRRQNQTKKNQTLGARLASTGSFLKVNFLLAEVLTPTPVLKLASVASVTRGAGSCFLKLNVLRLRKVEFVRDKR